MASSYNIDNAVPSESDYPTFAPAPFSEQYLIVREGEYTVDREGLIRIVTSGNNDDWPNEYLRSIGEPFLRARYLGNAGDSFEYANQIRRATIAEIQVALRYAPSRQFKLDGRGQAKLL